tara:strand:- start:9242 stop:10456 length:1215 start_codon:yes stop_codon:yes gene_type:complete
VTTLKDFSLLIIKNESLLDSIKDYFYENLLHDFEDVDGTQGAPHMRDDGDDHRLLKCSIENINESIEKVKTKYVVVIQEGIFFFDHIDNNFLKSVIENINDYALIGHVLDRKERYYHLHEQQFILDVEKWKQIDKPDFNRRSGITVNIERANENFHHDYTPTWIKKSEGTTSYDRLKFGGYVISELLKNNFKVRPFNTDERHVKKFVYYSNEEQVSHMLSYEKINPYSFYYPKTTRVKERVFKETANKYITVANAIESLYKIKNVYKEIKSIDFYDVSITALLFTELFIKNFNGDYKSFVKEFDNMGARPWTTLDLPDDNYDQLDDYDDVKEISDVLTHIRQNVNVNYYYGDITRSSIVESLDQPTLMHISNCFKYQYNFVRSSEWKFWQNKAEENQYLKQFLE